MEDNLTLDWLYYVAYALSVSTTPIISILLIIGLIKENKILLIIGTVMTAIIGGAFLISHIANIIKLIAFERYHNNSKKHPKKN